LTLLEEDRRVIHQNIKRSAFAPDQPRASLHRFVARDLQRQNPEQPRVPLIQLVQVRSRLRSAHSGKDEHAAFHERTGQRQANAPIRASDKSPFHCHHHTLELQQDKQCLLRPLLRAEPRSIDLPRTDERLSLAPAASKLQPMTPADLPRRGFLKRLGFGSTLLMQPGLLFADERAVVGGEPARTAAGPGLWPVLRQYDRHHQLRIAMPIGGIGTGTVSLGGRGNLRDWEIMNRPSKGFVPAAQAAPFVAVYLQRADGTRFVRALEGPLDATEYHGSHGSTAPNHGLPRFRDSLFAVAYPLAQVLLLDPDSPVDARLEAWNPLVPTDAEASGFPVAILRYALHNKNDQPLTAAVCASLPNFVGNDGSETRPDWKGDPQPIGEKDNRNRYREGAGVRGLFMDSAGVDPKAAAWGSLALVTVAEHGVSYRTQWESRGWGGGFLDFWDDFAADGVPEERAQSSGVPMGSLAVQVELPPHSTRKVTFVLAWHFPNRRTWTPSHPPGADDIIGNYYTTRFADAWEAAERLAADLDSLERRTVGFVRAFCESDLPDPVKEAALFNVSTLRSQTCFRTPDGHLFGFEGCATQRGCCHGSCTHVWNYEVATPFLFGELARCMRVIELDHATDDQGLMSFRVGLPLDRARHFGKAAADGQMGCILKLYREWQLSGDESFLHQLWPKARKALEFCWIPGGWDADRDGVMEGCQHNTMDVEYYGPNPQMEFWYLGALRAAEEMARHVGDSNFAAVCHQLFENGRAWTDAHLFNGEYYEHRVQLPRDASEIAPSLRIGMGAADPTRPDFQLGAGCLVDQLAGQFMAHVCGLGYLADPAHIRRTLESIRHHNHRPDLTTHFNHMRSYALGNERALLMASFPKERPQFPFPYFSEAMTGFEYTAAIGMLYEGQVQQGLNAIRDVRNRYDGRRRCPFDEAECGHHYARAMASWAAVLAFTGFHYSGVTQRMEFKPQPGRWFWSNGHAFGLCTVQQNTTRHDVLLAVEGGRLRLRTFALNAFGAREWPKTLSLDAGDRLEFEVSRA
jgi:non-lysosomal glucosylceramidase